MKVKESYYLPLDDLVKETVAWMLKDNKLKLEFSDPQKILT